MTSTAEAPVPPDWRPRIPWRYRRLGRPAVMQHSEMDCGAASLATVCRYYGKRLSLNALREQIRVGRAGASMANLSKAAQRLGFETENLISTWDDLAAGPLPAIANWKGFHWIVIHAMTDRDVQVADPGRGLLRIPRAEFMKNWTGYTIKLTLTQALDLVEDSPPALGFVKSYLVTHKRTFVDILVAALVSQVLVVVFPLFSKFVMDEVIFKGNQSWLDGAFLAMAVVVICLLAMNGLRQLTMLHVGQRIGNDLVKDVYQHVLRLNITFFENRKSGDIITRFGEYKKISAFLTDSGPKMLINVIAVIGYILLMLWFDVGLTGLVVVFVFGHVAVVKLVSPRIRQLYREIFELSAEASSVLRESLKGIQTIKTIGSGSLARGAFEEQCISLANVHFRVARYAQLSRVLTQAISRAASIALLFVGASLVMRDELTVGTLLAFTLLGAALFAPVNQLAAAWDQYQEMLNAVERLGDILEKESESQPYSPSSALIRISRLMGRIDFRRVTFRYNPDDANNVLQNVSLAIRAGDKVALVGPSGCGKSTIVKLLHQSYHPTSGQIIIDGFDAQDLWLQSVRRNIGMVVQDPMIFRGSIRENIAIARPGASTAAIIEAARLAQADDFILAMVGGYDAAVSEQGRNLSGGQRQRLALARAFLLDPSILVLDEATSALDNATEKLVMDAIYDRFADRTVIMIAHRLSTIRQCNLIACLNNGLLVESGTHDQLMAAEGLYYHLNSRHA